MDSQAVLSVQPAAADQMAALYGIMALAGEHMHRVLGLSHWHPFPPLEWFITRSTGREVFGVYRDGVLVGTFNLSTQPEPYYLPEMDAYWADPAAPALYFSAFGLLPVVQQQGIGSWCMAQVDELVRARGYGWVRFDAVGHHARLLHFYDRLGYEQRGLLNLGEVSVMCYEKALA